MTAIGPAYPCSASNHNLPDRGTGTRGINTASPSQLTSNITVFDRNRQKAQEDNKVRKQVLIAHTVMFVGLAAVLFLSPILLVTTGPIGFLACLGFGLSLIVVSELFAAGVQNLHNKKWKTFDEQMDQA